MMKHQLDPEAKPKECQANVEAKVKRDGGKMVTGYGCHFFWDIVELVPHCVWEAGELVDISPWIIDLGETEVPFLPEEYQDVGSQSAKFICDASGMSSKRKRTMEEAMIYLKRSKEVLYAKPFANLESCWYWFEKAGKKLDRPSEEIKGIFRLFAS